MKILKIDKNTWNQGLEKSRSSYRLVGPAREKGTHLFRELNENELPDMAYTETRLSPKSLVFPQSEVLLTYTTDESKPDHHLMKEVAREYPQRAVIGIRPFDAKALQLVKLNFDTPDYQDPYWINAYHACTFVGLAVNTPDSLDFSTSCGTGPFDEAGLDVLLVDAGDHYLAKVLTDKGGLWAEAAGFETEAEEGAASLIEEMKAAAAANISSKISFGNIKDKTVLELFEADHWEDTAFGCLNCGTCTYACPTCWCFDIQDEVQGTDGVRVRNWDSCMTSLFTLHGSGHNPREYPWQRTRQRFMHKLKYFSDKYGEGIMCVGCGRCVKQCPANIDIREICDKMNSQGE